MSGCYSEGSDGMPEAGKPDGWGKIHTYIGCDFNVAAPGDGRAPRRRYEAGCSVGMVTGRWGGRTRKAGSKPALR